ncbi:MAG: hypothetical protein JWQ33_1445 [Ramlibacter sp.]|nr:hypothetical protein [Ramlibacter sp.]
MRAELDALLSRLDIPVVMITHPDDLALFGQQVLHLREKAGLSSHPDA